MLWKSRCKLNCLESFELLNESKMPQLLQSVLAEYQFPPSLTDPSLSNTKLKHDPCQRWEGYHIFNSLNLKHNLYLG